MQNEKREWNSDISKFPKWKRVIDHVNNKYPPSSNIHLEMIREMYTNTLKKFSYIADLVDVWKTPAEFMNDGGGDCEDFAIYWWNYLRMHGADEDRVEVVIGSLQSAFVPKIIHAVTYVHLAEMTVVMDCRNDRLQSIDVPKFEPIFALNKLGWRLV